MPELTLLRALLLLSLAIAPLGTHRHFLGPSRARNAAHAAALGGAAVGLWSSARALCGAWLLFCAGSFALFLRSRRASLGAPATLAACVPFLFSNIAAVWLVAGANDLGLLGYGEHFSYYASLHGNVLGWTMLGAVAILADRASAARRVYLLVVLGGLISFLLIAFGIDRLHALKPLGVAGLTLAIPGAQLAFLREAWGRHRGAFALGAVSLAGLALTMALAWGNEMALPWLTEFAGLRAMVAIHGVLNAVVIAPCFLLAVMLAKLPGQGSG